MISEFILKFTAKKTERKISLMITLTYIRNILDPDDEIKSKGLLRNLMIRCTLHTANIEYIFRRKFRQDGNPIVKFHKSISSIAAYTAWFETYFRLVVAPKHIGVSNYIFPEESIRSNEL